MQHINLLGSNEIKYIHFIGIGGISMSGLAEILLSLGYKISGSDMRSSNITQRLESLGINISIGHSESNISNPDLVVYTAAVKEDNAELARARSLPISVIDRASLLGEVMKRYPYSIAVAGTHGKTTTTSMVTMIMLQSQLNPTVHIGGELDAIGGNTKIGGDRYFITEACEYVESFLKFNPYLAVVLNIDADHLDYYRDIEHIKESFSKFVDLVPPGGYAVACADDSNAMEILQKASCNKITYGINSQNSMWTARNIEFDQFGSPSFRVFYNNEFFADINLNVPGIHNVNNALAAIASCHTMGCGVESIQQGLGNFFGTHRRFELKGQVNNIRVVDDYAHHPSEVTATLKAAKNTSHSRLWCIFQPHTYTRTKCLLNEFSTAFSEADVVILSDIYAAREKDTGEIHSRVLADRIKAIGQDAIYISGFEAIVEYLLENTGPGDLVLTMGAGDIYKVGEMFVSKLSNSASGKKEAVV